MRSRFVVGWCMAIVMPPSSSSVRGRHAASSATGKVAAGAGTAAAATSSSSPSAAVGGAAPGPWAGKGDMLPLHKVYRAAEAAPSLLVTTECLPEHNPGGQACCSHCMHTRQCALIPQKRNGLCALCPNAASWPAGQCCSGAEFACWGPCRRPLCSFHSPLGHPPAGCASTARSATRNSLPDNLAAPPGFPSHGKPPLRSLQGPKVGATARVAPPLARQGCSSPRHARPAPAGALCRVSSCLRG